LVELDLAKLIKYPIWDNTMVLELAFLASLEGFNCRLFEGLLQDDFSRKYGQILINVQQIGSSIKHSIEAVPYCCMIIRQFAEP